MEGEYHTAQVCLNGHTITSSIEWDPELTAPYCAHCGAATIDRCLGCKAGIRGNHHIPGAVAFPEYSPPNFCFSCGRPFPWTEARSKAAKELVDELTELQPGDRETLKAAIGDLSSDTPRTELAVYRYTEILKKAGRGVREALTSIMMDIATEAAKKLLFGNGG